MQSSANTAWVGLIVIVAALLLSAAMLVLGGAGITLFTPGKYEVLARFENVTGIDRGMAVTANGLKVGVVDEIIAQKGRIGSGSVDVRLKIDKRVALRRDAQAIVEQPEFLGDQVMVLEGLSGPSEPPEIKDGDVIEGVNSGGLAQIVSDRAEETTEALMENVTVVQGKVEMTLDNFNELLKATTAIMSTNQGAIAGTMKNMQAASAGMVAISAQLARASGAVAELASDPRNKETLSGISADLLAMTNDMKTVTASMSALASDSQFGEDTKATLAETRKTMENLNAALGALQPTMGKTGALIEETTSTMKAVGDVARGVGGIMGGDSKAVSGAKSKLSSVGENVHVRLDMDTTIQDSDDSSSYSKDDQRSRDINAFLGYGGVFGQFGYDNIGLPDGGFNFMVGKGDPNKGFSYKTGAYRGEVGTGASYRWKKNAGFDGYMFDANDPKYNFYGKFPLGQSFSVTGGVEDITGESQIAVGVGLTH